MMSKYIIAALLLLNSLMAAAQNVGKKILTGPDGAVLQVGGLYSEAIKMSFLPAGTSLEVYKSVNNGNSRKIATVSFPGSAREIQQRLGEQLSFSLLQQLKVSTVEQAYSRIAEKGPAELGFLLFAEAFGLVYVDRTWSNGQLAEYSFQVSAPSGKRTIPQKLSAAETSPGFDTAVRFRLSGYTISDSSMTALWSAKTGQVQTHFVQLMRGEGNKRDFRATARPAMAFQKGDSIYVQYHESLSPGSQTKYFIRPTDWAGNTGLPSDTLHVLALNSRQLQGIGGLTVTDTLNGLLLQWDPLPREAVYAGIQILKSRQAGSDYVVLDTIPATSTSYLDIRLLPNVNYFYKVAPIFLQLSGAPEPPFAEAAGAMLKTVNNVVPAKPMGLRARLQNGKAHLQWNPAPDVNIFGYYVLRGTSYSDLTVISGLVKAHEYADSLFSPNYSGEYVYAVKAIHQNQQSSELSDPASVNLRQPLFLPAPGGVSFTRRDEGVYLHWDHSYFGVNGVNGYFVYARKQGETHFTQLNEQPIREPFYVDTQHKNQAMEYAVAGCDVWGNQSELSPLAAVKPEPFSSLAPPPSITLRNNEEGISISWPVPYDQENIKYSIYRKLTTEKDFRKIATVAPIPPYVDRTAVKGNFYEYTLTVLTDGGIESVQTSPSSIGRQ